MHYPLPHAAPIFPTAAVLNELRPILGLTDNRGAGAIQPRVVTQ